MYDYREAVKADVKRVIQEEYDLTEYEDREYAAERLHEDLWIDDSVTGNASGSYTFSTYKAEENLAHNWGLMVNAAEEWGMEPTISDGYEHGPEWWDVTIRCYLLGDAINEVLDELWEE